MTGEFIGMGPCYGCGRIFKFNPETVPSIPIDPITRVSPDQSDPPTPIERAVKQPLCEPCIEFVNAKRAEKGMKPWPVLRGAYL